MFTKLHLPKQTRINFNFFRFIFNGNKSSINDKLVAWMVLWEINKIQTEIYKQTNTWSCERKIKHMYVINSLKL